jgi:hypothetical protein
MGLPYSTCPPYSFVGPSRRLPTFRLAAWVKSHFASIEARLRLRHVQ